MCIDEVNPLSAATTHLPRPHRLRPGIDGSPPPLLAAPAVGGGGDLGSVLGATKGP
jgi:hypothetical protein